MTVADGMIMLRDTEVIVVTAHQNIWAKSYTSRTGPSLF